MPNARTLPAIVGSTLRRLLAPLLLLVAGCATPPPPAPVAAVPPQTLATMRYRVVLVAGDPSLEVWDRAVERVAAGLRDADAAAPGMQRFSARPERQASGASPTTRDGVLRAIAAMRPQPGEGCFVMLTMHGAPNQGLSVMPERRFLSPAALDAALAAGCGDAPTFVVASGCFSGGFAQGGMARPNRVVLTAARADRASFGCTPRFALTVFDGCLIDALRAGAPAARVLAAGVAGCVAAAETRLRVAPPSEPQAHIGATVPGLVPRFAAGRA